MAFNLARRQAQQVLDTWIRRGGSAPASFIIGARPGVRVFSHQPSSLAKTGSHYNRYVVLLDICSNIRFVSSRKRWGIFASTGCCGVKFHPVRRSHRAQTTQIPRRWLRLECPHQHRSACSSSKTHPPLAFPRLFIIGNISNTVTGCYVQYVTHPPPLGGVLLLPM